ncbi:GntR family transcriptional regulator [Actinoplanes rectilineatus]|uniref:GntR family transcriptional regulator n=1 Tax=Actinoplanes rectilineatus TaxID=113571 RepID=UPI0005F2C8FD|nr:GntR family transcriptional regulator [Actinoplanes rectilineatus]
MTQGLPRISDTPSLAQRATTEIRAMILNGGLAPGERLVETSLGAALGVSRPPLREALRALAGEGLVRLEPRLGASVVRLTVQDAYEIMTLRHSLERTAVELGVPVHDPWRLTGLRAATATMTANAEAGAEDLAIDDSLRFHLALVELPGHRRLADAYRALQLQLRLCMALNRGARAHAESLTARAARHARLFAHVEAGDRDAVLAGLDDGTPLSFLPLLPGADEADDAARAWLRHRSGSG